jgi:steroid 5-alpha reductase family enzyme
MDTVAVFPVLALVGGLITIYMTGLFGLSVIMKDNSVADIGWGFGFVLAAITSLVVGGMSSTQVLLTVLVTVWGLRLTAHIYLRHRGKPEDFRYAVWRKEWGEWFYLRSYVQVFLLQGALMMAVSSTVILTNAMQVGSQLQALVIAGLLVWLIGFIFETVGDYQLSQFIKNPQNKGKIMRTGLWKYSRHPNYFGEVTGCLSANLQ